MTTGDGVSTLEHLAELDRLLREVQVELGTGREPAPVLSGSPPRPPPLATAPPPAPPPPPAGTSPPPATPSPATQPDPNLQALTRLTTRLLASIRELLDGYEQVLVPPGSADAPGAARARSPGRPRPRATGRGIDPDVTVSAGPFASVEALRTFERSVARLPGVREVAVRGYEGADRAIIEVRLDHASP